MQEDQVKKHKNYGKIPQYLNRYNLIREEAIQAEVQRKLHEASVPPGMRIMPDDERLETLRDL